jgi:F0F1-type ATP synthase assembly protein I
MAFELVGIIVGSILSGVFLDQWLGWSPILTLIFSFAGIIGAFVKMLTYGGKKR